MNQVTLWTLWGFISLLIPVYAVATHVMTRGDTPRAPDVFVMMLASFAIVTALSTFLIWWLGVSRRVAQSQSPTALRVFASFIVIWAFADAIALWGGVVAFSGYRIDLAFGFFAVAMGLMVIHMPRTSRLTGTQLPLGTGRTSEA